ncbi:aldehyde dehydrogenase [Pseudomaricurvus alkylphenolicus]|uniref:aldehyde dehydrogenase family protein n=1 Tax=Pseudomaricurvus alkylphenolicus TaxID=1306991 RepID=UPI0014231B97|nr:aldehyde dehydrogenase family protein [Pseudomaricurvus alkylphenolicus]NIB38698.1 aldehyde dehydrogenase [Pseudomaricurvus alkylphenolicus]
MSSFDFYCKNFIDGQWCSSESSRTFEVRNPAVWSEVLHRYPKSTDKDTARAVESASNAFASWKSVALSEKSTIMRRMCELIREHRDQIAVTITRENGKLISESLVEIDSALLELEYQVGEGQRQFGTAGESFKGGILGHSRKEPLGVVSAIIPWNFPFNVPLRKLVPALMAGNTAILKPAGQTPAVGEIVTRLFQEAGLPSGVLQFVTGSGAELSSGLVAHPKIKAVTFTGSTEVGRQIAVTAADTFTRTQLEMGGKNPLVVLADADVDAAAEAAVIGAFSCAGQWCTATSRLIVENSVADILVDKVIARAKELVLGNGNDTESSMGPVCGKQQQRQILQHIHTAKHQGAKLRLGGSQVMEGELSEGCFVEPTVFDCVDVSMDIAKEEIFGPILAIMRVEDYEAALQLANDVPYGLSSSIFTRDIDKALHFTEHSEVGLTHVNIHSAYKEPQLCFGGYKDSGFGLPEAGSAGIQFFQEEKAIYLKKADKCEPVQSSLRVSIMSCE